VVAAVVAGGRPGDGVLSGTQMPSSRPRIYLVRHGETEWAREGRHTGLTDVPLTPAGEAAARELGRRLAGIQFGTVLSSPLQRARRTAELAGFGPQLELESGLREWNYGRFEGCRIGEIRAERPGWLVFRDGAPEGESPADVSLRADRMVARVRAPEADVLIFSHGHFLRALTARWLGLPLAAGTHFLLAPAALSILGYEHGNLDEPALIRWNDHAHV
jgi:broad specificity phosphatase PhoE